MNQVATTEKIHIPKEGTGVGLIHTAECGQPMHTRTADIDQVRRSAMSGLETDRDAYCQACARKAGFLVEIKLYCSGENHGKGRFSTQIAHKNRIDATVRRMIREYEAVMEPGCIVEVDGEPYTV